MKGWLILALCALAPGCTTPPEQGARARALASDAAAADKGGGCGAVSKVGCCAGPKSLRYCAGSHPKTKACPPGQVCGWSATYGLYSCGASAGADPSGVAPYACPAPDSGVDAAAAKDAAAADLGVCSGPGHVGCCQGQTLIFCAGGKLLSLDCSKNPSCGWSAASGYYDCATAGKPDPSGKHALACSWPGDAGAPDSLFGDGPTPDLAAAPADQAASPGDAVSDAGSGNEGFTIVPDTVAHLDASEAPDQAAAEVGPGLDVSGFEGGTADIATVATGGGGGCSCQAGGQGALPAFPLAGLILLLGLLRRRPPKAAAVLLLGVALAVPGCLDDPVATGGHTPALGAADAGQADSQTCGAISATGCCDGETLWWCASGQLRSMSCRKRPRCGWSNAGRYDCDTSGAADPTGKNAQGCRALTRDAGLPASDGPSSDGGAPCGGITIEGCCKGNTLIYCVAARLRSIPCTLNPKCGWHPGGQLYDCGTEGKSDPAGKHKRQCPATLPADLGLDGPIPPDGAPVDLTAPDAAAGAGSEPGGCAAAGGGPGPATPWWGVLALLSYFASRRRPI